MAIGRNPLARVPLSADRRLVPVTAGTTVTPGVGTLTITGYAPTVTRTANQSLTPITKALVLAGFIPTVARTANQSLTPITTALVITGYAPTVVQAAGSTSLTPGTGQINITGYAPVIAQTGGDTPIIYHLGTPIRRKTGAERERELLERYGLADSPIIEAITKQPEKPATAIALAMLAAKENIFTEFLKKPALNTTVAYKIPTNIAITQELLAEMEDEDAAIVCAIAMML